MTASCSGPRLLRLRPRRGRLRVWRHGLLAGAVAAAGWIWFGGAGALLLMLWWWSRRPRGPAAARLLDVAGVRQARLGRWRTQLTLSAGLDIEVFHDELDPEALALLRREVGRQLAAGLRTSRRSENPGNRMVSSDLGNVSG